MPLQMRLPKRGFKSPNRIEYVAFNVGLLGQLAEKHGFTEINPENLIAAGIIRKNDRVKVLGDGELSAALRISAHAASAKAKSAVEAAGGTIDLV